MEAVKRLRRHPLDDLLRPERLPHLWCPGCGLGIALGAILRAVKRRLDEGYLQREKVAFIGGIGCSARASLYVDFDSAHTVHGRAIPFATGLKAVRPDMKVIVIGGDGDIAGIGGNHLMHAARRNIDLLVIMMNNMVYAMTGGQLAPTTPTGLYTTTTPYGNPERPINVVKLVATMGANYVARASVTHPPLIERYVYKALGKKGFAFIEIISTCPEVFGRHIGMRDAVELLNALRERVVVKQRPHIDESYYEWEGGKFVLGEYVDKDDPSYLERIGVIKG